MLANLNLTPTALRFELELNQRMVTGRTWGTASESRAAALLVHGLGAHSGWFEALGRQFKVKGMYALAYDQLGFGERQDQKFVNYQQWLDDLSEVYQYLARQVKDKPVYLMGNSMGALIALCQTSSLKPAGLVLFSPGFEGHPSTFTFPFRLKAIFQGLLKPESEIELPYKTDLITRLESVRHWVDNDPERRFKIPAGMLTDLLTLTWRMKKHYRQITTPVLMLTAGVERIVDNQVSQKVFAQLGSLSKHHQHYPEAWHDLMFDPQIDEVADAVIDWISELSGKTIGRQGPAMIYPV